MLSQVLADSKHWQIQEDEQKAHSLPSRTGEIQEHDAYASARIQVGCMKTSKMLPPHVLVLVRFKVVRRQKVKHRTGEL